MSGITHDQDLSNIMNGTTIVYLLISSVKISYPAVDKTLIARSCFGLLLSYDVFICSIMPVSLRLRVKSSQYVYFTYKSNRNIKI